MEGVTLGMPGKWASSNYEVADIYTTKIGGFPDWPFSIASETPDLLQCITCRNKLSLLAQVYAPLPSTSSEIERVIYVFCCLLADCQSPSWRALRVQKISSNEATNKPTSLSILNNNCKDDRWREDSIEDEDDMDMEQLLMEFSEAANINSTSKREKNDVESSKKHRLGGQPVRSVDKTPVFPCFYIYPLEEKLLKRVSSGNSKHGLPSLQESESNSEDPSDGEIYEEENYEYDRALNADRTYLKFKKRMDVYQEQCFRYSYGGKPLLASSYMGDPGICNLCGGSRHYEMQLMPPLIYFLQEASDEGQRTLLEKLDWMTLLVYTCSKSCSDSSYPGNFGHEDWTVAEEFIIAQCE